MKMKLDAMKHHGKVFSSISRQVVGKLESAYIVGENSSESGRQIQHYIRLTELIPEIHR